MDCLGFYLSLFDILVYISIYCLLIITCSVSYLIYIVTSRKGPTRGNRRVPLSEIQFPELHSRVRKANDNEFIFNLINYPKDLVFAYKKISTENLTELCLKYGYPPAQRKQFIKQFPSMGNHKSISSKIP